MTTFVLVPGMWLGGWAWDGVAERLRQHGHEVHAVTLSGQAGADLSTHVDEVVAALPDDACLVGHSYAGSVITMAAERATGRVAQLIYVDTGPMPDGMSQADFEGRQPPPGDHVPPPATDGLPPALTEGVDWAALLPRLTPHPRASVVQPASITGTWAKLPRTAVLCTFTEEQVRQFAASAPVFALMATEGWRYEELPTGHWPMFSRPADLADLLSRAAAG